jgi:16S rRNA (cytidine1402-2'-O)-methyltransferase
MGTLVLVATPIGNLGDLQPRAIEVLAGAALVCCEDTRRSGRLLQHAGISAQRLRRVDDHTEHSATSDILDVLRSGATVALVTDAGTPGISDPGHRVVRAAIDDGHTVSAVPGPTAFVMALVISGLPCERFVFEGFLPRSGAERKQRVQAVVSEQRTVVLYEAPHRVRRTVDDLGAACDPNRRIAICRELTKMHENVWRGTIADASLHLASTEPLGEYVLVLEGAAPDEPADDSAVVDMLRNAMAAGSTKRDAAAEVARLTGRSRREVYDLTFGL